MDSLSKVGSKTRKIGLALGGGAARGIAHVGVLQALEAYQIPIDIIAGTSAGAVVGACYAAGIDTETMRHAVTKLSWSDFASFHFSKYGMMSSKPIQLFINRYIGNSTFADLKIPFAALATNISTGKGAILNAPTMDVGLAVRASSSFPGVLDPTEIGGQFYTDGGSVENLPISVARSLGADVVIAIDVIPRVALNKKLAHMMAFVDRGLDILLISCAENSKEKADIVLLPLTEYFASRHFKHAERMIELGVQAVVDNIDAIKAVVYEKTT